MGGNGFYFLLGKIPNFTRCRKNTLAINDSSILIDVKTIDRATNDSSILIDEKILLIERTNGTTAIC